jgi:hypothetical protein
MIAMLRKLNGRKLCSCREAADILGVTPGRVRQLAGAGEIWSEHLTPTAVVLDRNQITRIARERAKRRAQGPVMGRPPVGVPAAG